MRVAPLILLFGLLVPTASASAQTGFVLSIAPAFPRVELRLEPHSELVQCATLDEEVRCILIEAAHEDSTLSAYRSQLEATGWQLGDAQTNFAGGQVFRHSDIQTACPPFVQLTLAEGSRLAPTAPHPGKTAYLLVYSRDYFCMIRNVDLSNQGAPRRGRQ